MNSVQLSIFQGYENIENSSGTPHNQTEEYYPNACHFQKSSYSKYGSFYLIFHWKFTLFSIIEDISGLLKINKNVPLIKNLYCHLYTENKQEDKLIELFEGQKIILQITITNHTLRNCCGKLTFRVNEGTNYCLKCKRAWTFLLLCLVKAFRKNGWLIMPKCLHHYSMDSGTTIRRDILIKLINNLPVLEVDYPRVESGPSIIRFSNFLWHSHLGILVF